MKAYRVRCLTVKYVYRIIDVLMPYTEVFYGKRGEMIEQSSTLKEEWQKGDPNKRAEADPVFACVLNIIQMPEAFYQELSTKSMILREWGTL